MERPEEISARLASTLRYYLATRVFAVKRAPQITALRPYGAIFIHRGGPKGHECLTRNYFDLVKEMLESKVQSNPNDLIFCDENGNKIKKISNTFSRVVNDLDFNEGVEDLRMKVTFHTLRHTFASWLVQGGENLYTVQKLLGYGYGG